MSILSISTDEMAAGKPRTISPIRNAFLSIINWSSGHIGADNIEPLSIDDGCLAANSVTNAKVANLAISTPKLVDNAVTIDKMAAVGVSGSLNVTHSEFGPGVIGAWYQIANANFTYTPTTDCYLAMRYNIRIHRPADSAALTFSIRCVEANGKVTIDQQLSDNCVIGYVQHLGTGSHLESLVVYDHLVPLTKDTAYSFRFEGGANLTNQMFDLRVSGYSLVLPR